MEDKKNKEKLNFDKLNTMFNTGNKVLKLLYIILVLLIVYIISLVAKEWKLLQFLLKILTVISPLFFGILIAWLLNPFVIKLNKRGMSRTFATIIVYIWVIIIIFLFSRAFIPALADQVNEIVTSIPTILSDLKEWVDNLFIRISDKNLMNIDNVKIELFDSIEKFGNNLAISLPKIAIGFIQSFVSGIGLFLMSLIVGFYMLLNFPNLKVHLINILPKKTKKDTEKLISSISLTISEYVKGTLLIASILFVVYYIGFLIIGLKAPVLFALFGAITDVIPYIGPYIGGAAASLVGFTQSNATGTFTVIFIIIAQALESNVLQPVIMSKKTNLHPVTILLGLLIFGAFFGIIGMIVATPVIAILKIVYVFLDEKYGFFEYKENYDRK